MILIQVLSVDPSIRKLGCALMCVQLREEHEPDFTVCQNTHICELLQCASLDVLENSEEHWITRAYVMVQALLKNVRMNLLPEVPVLAVIETPENWFGPRGVMAKDSEAIQKLYFFCGMLNGALVHLPHCVGVAGVTPTRWKGQTSKEKMVQRAYDMCRTYNWDVSDLTDDAAEALMLGGFTCAQIQIEYPRALRTCLRLPVHFFQVLKCASFERVEEKVEYVLPMPDASSIAITDYFG